MAYLLYLQTAELDLSYSPCSSANHVVPLHSRQSAAKKIVGPCVVTSTLLNRDTFGLLLRCRETTGTLFGVDQFIPRLLFCPPTYHHTFFDYGVSLTLTVRVMPFKTKATVGGDPLFRERYLSHASE